MLNVCLSRYLIRYTFPRKESSYLRNLTFVETNHTKTLIVIIAEIHSYESFVKETFFLESFLIHVCRYAVMNGNSRAFNLLYIDVLIALQFLNK